MNNKADFTEYINQVFYTTETAGFNERFGNPSELHAIIGLMSIKFAEMETELSKTITFMLQLDEDRGHIVTSELSFRGKVDMFSSLYMNLKDRFHFNTFPGFETQYVKALVGAMNRMEGERNQIIHSTFQEIPNKITRRKITAKQKKGLVRQEEEVEMNKLLNMVDVLYSIIMEIQDFQIDIMGDKKTFDEALAKNGFKFNELPREAKS